jgi:hypothetical protein
MTAQLQEKTRRTGDRDAELRKKPGKQAEV